MNIASCRLLPKWALFLLIIVLLLSSACKLFLPQTPTTPPKLQNQPPVIQSVTAEKEINISTECKLICKATDADGDTLKYWWSADGGMIRGTGDNVTWIAPAIGGNYNIKVMVSDGKGGETTISVTITAIGKPNQSPVITSLTIDGNPAKETQQTRVWITKTIECVAQDPDGDQLRYAWSTTGGKIQEVGAKVGWTAPGVAGNYKIIVTVTDSKGGKVQASVNFDVDCCGQHAEPLPPGFF